MFARLARSNFGFITVASKSQRLKVQTRRRGINFLPKEIDLSPECGHSLRCLRRL